MPALQQIGGGLGALGSLPAGIPPEAYPDYVTAQRRAMLAQALMGGALTPLQQPEAAGVRGLNVQPRISPLTAASKLGEALLSNKAEDKSIRSQIAMQTAVNAAYSPQHLISEGTPLQSAPQGPDAGTNAAGDNQGVAPLVQRAPGASLAQTVQGTQPTFSAPNPRNPMNLPADAVARLAQTDPKAYAEMLQGTPEWRNALAAYGGDERMAMAALQTKYGQEVRPENTLVMPTAPGQAPAPVFQAPRGSVQTTFGPNGPTQSTIPGGPAAQQTEAAAVAAGTQSQTPIKLGTDSTGRDVYGFPSPPGPGQAATPGTAQTVVPRAGGALNATAPGVPESPALHQSQVTGGEQGQQYAKELAANATGATEVRRSLSELRNLAQQATPASMNEGKSKLGAYMIAAGVAPETVSKWLGVDVGALQAAQKQTATLAVNSIHAMTSRGTNFDLDTFIRNNPNMNMADPGAFQRVVDYMDNKARQEVLKQRDFVQWKKGVSPDEWESGHTAHWLDLQNQNIDQGRSNSRPPLSGFVVPGS